MPSTQKDIYYISAENDAAAQVSPQLEAFRSRGYEVLFCTDPIDDWIMQDMTEYKEKHFRCITKGDIDLDTEDEKKAKEAERKEQEEENKPLLEALKDALKDKVRDVKLSRRLTESACCLVGDEYSMGPQFEKMMKAMHQDMPEQKKTLEINAAHPLIQALRGLQKKDTSRIAEYASFLYDQALLVAQEPLQDPVAFAQKMSSLMAQSLANEK